MIPIPSINYIPKIFADNNQLSMIALTNKLDSTLSGILTDVINLQYLVDVERCPSKFLVYLGYLVNADIRLTDSETTKRQKIYKAISTHKLRSTWNYHAKIIIDAITGYNAVIYRQYDTDDWIETGDGALEVGTDWAIESGDGLTPFGMVEIGAGSEIEIQGNIYIDCHYGVIGSTLSAAQIADIVEQIQYDVMPAYMRIYLGYIDGSGIFNTYAGGTIG